MINLRLIESDNDELVNHLVRRNLIRSAQVERVHRAVDRAKYVSPVDRDQAYLLRPWRRGALHLSSPCIYGVVLEALELKPGLSFLNVGSGTGYLSTMAGLILGPNGINHGVEVEPSAVEYANNILEQFIETSPVLDEIDFCDTKFYKGNGLCLSGQQAPYDRLYCGTECSSEQLEYFKRLIRIGGVLVLPVHNVLVQVKRTSEDRWTTRNLISVVFAKLKLPTTEEAANPFEIEVLQPPRLKILCCVKVRQRLRASLRVHQGLLHGPLRLLRRPPSNDTNVNELLRLLHKRNQNPWQRDAAERSLGSATTPELPRQEGMPMVHDDSDLESCNDERPSSSSTDEEEDYSQNRWVKLMQRILQREPRLFHSTDSSHRSSLIDESLSSSRSSPSPSVFAFFARCLEQENNNTFHSDGLNTSVDNRSTQNSNQPFLSHDNTPPFVSPRPVWTLVNPFDSFLEKIKNAKRIHSDASDTSDDDYIKIIPTDISHSIAEVTNESNIQSEDERKSPDNVVESKRVPLLFDVSLLRSFTEVTNKSNKESFSDDDIESIDDATKTQSKKLLLNSNNLSSVSERTNEANVQINMNEKLDSGIEEGPTTSSEANVQCSKDKRTDGLVSSVCVRGDVQLASTSVQPVYEHNLTELQSSDDINESSSKHLFVERWIQKSNLVENNVTGIFARLNITDPTSLSSVPLAKAVHPVTVPVSFKTLPAYIDKIWETMQSFKCRSFDELDNDFNKAVFKKGALMLAEAKVAYSQRTTPATPDEDLPTSRTHNKEKLEELNQMAAKLPLPVALYLECLGTTKYRDQVITPVLAVHVQDARLSGAITYAPTQMVTLLQLLREGVPLNGVVHQLCLKELDGLPMIQWENFCIPVAPPLIFGRLMVRITEESHNFWITISDGYPSIKWEHSDHSLFKRIVSSFDRKIGFNVHVDLSHGRGSLAQVVQTVDWSMCSSTRWFTNASVDDDSIKLGVAFAFSRFSDVRPSRFTGTLGTSYMRGEATPFRFISAILHNL